MVKTKGHTSFWTTSRGYLDFIFSLPAHILIYLPPSCVCLCMCVCVCVCVFAGEGSAESDSNFPYFPYLITPNHLKIWFALLLSIFTWLSYPYLSIYLCIYHLSVICIHISIFLAQTSYHLKHLLLISPLISCIYPK